jgi:hypothetical protein
MKIGFFDEAENQRSATRLIFIIGSLWAMGLTTYVVHTHPAMTAIDIGLLFGGLMTPLALSKVGQKFAEAKQDPQVTPTPQQ